MICKYCEPFETYGDRFIHPLPNQDSDYGGAQMCVSEDVDGSMWIVTSMYPPIVAGPINYCPMCGRKLVSE